MTEKKNCLYLKIQPSITPLDTPHYKHNHHQRTSTGVSSPPGTLQSTGSRVDSPWTRRIPTKRTFFHRVFFCLIFCHPLPSYPAVTGWCELMDVNRNFAFNLRFGSSFIGSTFSVICFLGIIVQVIFFKVVLFSFFFKSDFEWSYFCLNI